MCWMPAIFKDNYLESLFLPLGAAVCEVGSVCVVQTFELLLSAFAFAVSSFCYLCKN